MDPNSVFRVKGEYVVRKIAGETILVPVSSGVAELDSVFTLNETASVLWSGIQENRSFEAIVGDVVSTFDVSEEAARCDLEEFLVILQERGLVEVLTFSTES